MKNYHDHLIKKDSTAREALKQLDALAGFSSRTLFVTDENDQLLGTITDGDIRRGLLKGLEISHPILRYMNRNFKYLQQGEDEVDKIKTLRGEGIEFVPVLDHQMCIAHILDLTKNYSLIPASALIMAGGRGERLRPFTDTVPKPMLPVGAKPIIEHTIDRLIQFGISEIFISVRYLKEQIKDYIGDGSKKGVSIIYVEEEESLGTIGALSLVNKFSNEHLLVMNSDILTNIDLEDFFNTYMESQASMCVASIPYKVSVPYAVLQTENKNVTAFVEKPSYTYYSNGGIYFLKSALRAKIPVNSFYHITDLMEKLIADGNRVSHYPLLDYWLDIGKQQDYMKAQDDIKHIRW